MHNQNWQLVTDFSPLFMLTEQEIDSVVNFWLKAQQLRANWLGGLNNLIPNHGVAIRFEEILYYTCT